MWSINKGGESLRACLEVAFGDKKHQFFVDTRHFLKCIPFGTDKKSNEVSTEKGYFLARRVTSKQALSKPTSYYNGERKTKIEVKKFRL